MLRRNSVIILKPYPKKKKRKKLKKILLTVMVVMIGLGFSFFLFLNYLIKKEIKEIEKLRGENLYYEETIKKITSSDEVYEEILRTKYGYIKPGEKIIIYLSKSYGNQTSQVNKEHTQGQITENR